jgi:hypothetical protein
MSAIFTHYTLQEKFRKCKIIFKRFSPFSALPAGLTGIFFDDLVKLSMFWAKCWKFEKISYAIYGLLSRKSAIIIREHFANVYHTRTVLRPFLDIWKKTEE